MIVIPRPLSSTVWASPQLPPESLSTLATDGILRIISNRPDGEDPGQPTSEAMAEAADRAGLEFAWIPVSGLPDASQVSAVATLLKDGKPTVMFCRSGMRSAACWAMAQRLDGTAADDLRATAATAGYDLSRVPL